jgi:phosphate transport system permease protein
MPTQPVADRFKTPRMTLLVDRVMTWAIKAGGVGIILAVSGIFVFILWQILPLFRSAQIQEISSSILPVSADQIRAVALDEWGESPVLIGADGRVHCNGVDGAWSSTALELGGRTVSTVALRRQSLALGTSDGTLVTAAITWETATVAGKRQISGKVRVTATVALPTKAAPLVALSYADGDARRTIAAILDDPAGRRVMVCDLESSGGLIGPKTLSVGETWDLTALVHGLPQHILIDERGDTVVVTTQDGGLSHFARSDQGFVIRQTPFKPFADAAQKQIASINWLLGDVSLVLSNPDGLNRLFSLYRRDGSDTRQFGKTKDFPDLAGGVTTYTVSERNKCFLVADGRQLSLRHGTSASERIAVDLPFAPRHAAISGKYHRIALTGDDDRLHLFLLNDPYPETGFKALFGKVWYEGGNQPEYKWQSSGASDDIEPKLSMVPLIWGTLKATFYALLFAIPVALLGAIYTAEFMHPRFKKIIKPAVEIMASLPSVVLGFIGALWLAPLIETRVPSLLLVAVLVPASAMLVGWWWSGLSLRWRSRIKPGYEYLAVIPVLLVVTSLAWSLGPALERLCFIPVATFTDPVSGLVTTKSLPADFRLWWCQVTSLSFEQRNALVVGLMMGFAVIPIIFTIAEDALSNVPATLRSGSLALGASRWQTALRVVVPTASAGIFSALMIGLGRAIGETMIVVMATGNTPIMSGNIFDGMRTLAANIAVELPEAPLGGTLARTLYLGAFLLFVLTFLVNTVAEIMRQHLREKYKTV